MARPDEALLLSELAHLLDAGVPVRGALSAIEQGRWPARLQEAVRATEQRIAAGQTFAEALQLGPGVPSALERAGLRGGEQAGRLTAVLRRLAAARETGAAVRESLLARLAYPALLIQMAAFVLALPRLATSTASFVATLLLYLLLANGVLIAAWLLIRRDVLRALRADGWPLIGRWLVARRQREYLEPLALLYASGVPWATAHGLARAAVSRPPVVAGLARADRIVAAGGGMIEALRATGVFTAEVDVQLANAEHAGRMEEALDRVVADLRRTEDQALATLVRAVARLVYGLAVALVVFTTVKFWLGYAARLRAL